MTKDTGMIGVRVWRTCHVLEIIMFLVLLIRFFSSQQWKSYARLYRGVSGVIEEIPAGEGTLK